MDAGPWQAIPPPPPYPPASGPRYAAPTWPPPPPPPGPVYGYAAPQVYWQPVPYGAPVPAPRRSWVTWLAVALACLAACVPVFGTVAGASTSARTGLHSVSGISSTPWSAEFVDSSGLPARWDPCTPIHYVVNPDGAPFGANDEVARAVARLSAASGLNFIDDGTTSERPSRDRDPYQPASYGNSWAPILVSWSSAQETDLLDDPRAEAVTVPIAVNSRSHTGGGSLVSAEVALNTARQLPVGFGPGPSEGEVLMHELGHAVGLGHVASMSEAMYPSVRGIAQYGQGDLDGFAAVGAAAGCHPAPAARELAVIHPPVG